MIKNLFSKESILGLILTTGLSLQPSQAMESLPDAIATLSFRHLAIKDLGNCALVSTRWNALSSTDAIWEEHAKNYEEAGGVFHRQYTYCFFNLPSWKTILKESYPFWEQLKIQQEEQRIAGGIFTIVYINNFTKFEGIKINKTLYKTESIIFGPSKFKIFEIIKPDNKINSAEEKDN